MFYNIEMKLRLLVVLTIMLVFFASCKKNSQEEKTAQPAPPPEESIIVFQINEKSFSLKDFHNFIIFQYGSVNNFKDNPNVLSRIFDQFIEQSLLIYEADNNNIQVTETDIEKFSNEMGLNDKIEKFERNFLTQIVKVQKYLTLYVYKDIKNSEKELQDYYQKNFEEFRKGSEILLAQIQVRDHQKAIEIRGELLNNPQKFEEFARNFSIAPEAANGGVMGRFEEKELPEEIESVVFSLRVGEISPVVETPYGFHIFKVLQRKGKRLLAFATIKDEIDQKILSEKLKAALQNTIDEIKKKVTINFFNEKLNFKYIQESSQQQAENEE